MAKQKLGRGLSAILDDVEDAYRHDIDSGDRSKIRTLSVDAISPNIYQPRKHFDETALKELSESIRQHGLLQPIVVVEKEDGYMLIAGERRLRATKLAGFETIEAIVADFESKNLRELALIENIQREELSPLELANSYRELIEEYDITQEELSNILHKSRSQITNTLRLLSLTPYTQELLNSQKLTQGHAKVLVGLDEETEKLIADTIVGQKLSVRESEELIKNIKTPPSENKGKTQKRKAQIDCTPLVEKFNMLGIAAKQNAQGIIITVKSPADAEKLEALLNQD
ncbi:MAG: chromosome partitioning protein ParB [Campylobacteraceae bacterium 4484_4]|nr:MAG: chromosome partitioning protein ParB [Campylobacteraceae bacterium 4484_4]